MQSLTYTSDEWQHAQPAAKDAVHAWVNQQSLPAGHIINLLYTDGQVVAEYAAVDMFGVMWLDVHASDASEPPAAFWECSRNISPQTQVAVEVPAPTMADAWRAWRDLTWSMVLFSGRRLRLWP